MHYGGHLRDAFIEWVWDNCPPEATVEINYEPTTVDWQWFMRRMSRCSDILPGDDVEYLEGLFSDIFEEATGTYGSVARWILKHGLPARQSARRLTGTGLGAPVWRP